MLGVKVVVSQVQNLRKHVCATGLLQRIELVITSPMLRYLTENSGYFVQFPIVMIVGVVVL